MNFKAYNQLRLLGYSPDEAVILQATFVADDMYEQKAETDVASHGGFAPVIGLKPEFKQLAIHKEQG